MSLVRSSKTFTALVVFALVFAGASPGLASARRPTALACKTGPCQQPDALDVLLRPATTEIVVSTNFGLLYPSPGLTSWHFVCEETFGGRLAENLQFHPDGRVFVPSLAGLFISESGGCSWTRGGGELKDIVWDVTIDRSAPSKVWALAGDIRGVLLSVDGGKTFALKQTFADGYRFIRILMAPSDPRVIYLSGYRSRVPLILAVSTDAGESWTINDVASEGIAGPGQTVNIAAIEPTDPSTFYVSVLNAEGDQIWKFGEYGKTKSMVLKLPASVEARAVTLGATSKDIFVAARAFLEAVGTPPATLFVSHDGGGTWTQRPVPDSGPRFRCLRYRDGKLYACAGDAPSGDAFLAGVSEDEGQTWTSLVRLSDLTGASACVRAACVTTAGWLCTTYGICDGASPPDAGVGGAAADAGTPKPPKRGGCILVVSAGRPSSIPLVAVATLLLLARRRKRRHHHPD